MHHVKKKNQLFFFLQRGMAPFLYLIPCGVPLFDPSPPGFRQQALWFNSDCIQTNRKLTGKLIYNKRKHSLGSRLLRTVTARPYHICTMYSVHCIIIIIIIISLLKTHVRRTCLHSKNITMKHTRVK